jgi:hypothetical protein
LYTANNTVRSTISAAYHCSPVIAVFGYTIANSTATIYNTTVSGTYISSVQWSGGIVAYFNTSCYLYVGNYSSTANIVSTGTATTAGGLFGIFQYYVVAYLYNISFNG